LQADSAEAALSVLSSGTPVDLLFTDVVMPGKLKTPELARHARQLHPAIAILFTSGYTENAIIHHGQLDEGVQLLSKPYRKDDLARKVRAVLKAPREAQVPPVQPIAPREPEAAMRRLRILVVEDELLVRLTTMDMLQELGHEVVDADTGAAALAAFASDPEIEVLLTDVGLPDMSGQTLAEKCRAQRPSLKVVFATGYDSRSVAEGLKTSATLTVLGKPFQTRELRKALAKAMAIENA
jgi:CheY-like chemotaxis protein